MKTTNTVFRLIKKANGMKVTGLLSLLALVMVSMLVASCDMDDDDNRVLNSYVANAVVTIKPMNDGKEFFIWVTDKKGGVASNITKSPFGGKEVRALANLRDDGLNKSGVQQFYVNWLDSIRTKPAVKTLGEKEDMVKFGNDPVEVVQDFTTVAEDGYLTLRFRALWSVKGKKQHVVSLVTGTNPKDPYELVFRHHAHGDTKGTAADALVAFRLAEIDSIAKAQGKKEVKLKLTWKSFAGQKSVNFNYRVRDDNLYK
uniref:NigD-like protein n=2 Tax=unclassified Prevotella TaxID=2638335 RepID=A0AB33JJJ4_9BACT